VPVAEVVMSQEGTIQRLNRDHTAGLIVDDEGNSYPFDLASLVDTEATQLEVGAWVEFDLGGAGGGVTSIRAAADKPKTELETPGLEETPTLEPPPSIARDKVAESSWESFPASDPPASGHIT